MADARSPPFFVGGPIPPALADRYLHGYEEERRLLAQNLGRRGPTRQGVFGDARSGKTSLLLAIAPDLPERRSHLECARIWPATVPGFLRLVAKALDVKAPKSLDQPAAGYETIPLPSKGGLLVLENAHHLTDIDKTLLDHLPALLDRLPWHVALTGETDALEGLVDDAIHLRPFSEATAADFLRRRFQDASLEVAPEVTTLTYEFSRGHPEAIQRIGHALWQHALRTGQARLGAADVEATLGDLLDRLPSHTLTAWAQVRGLMRDVFVAQCLYDLERPTEIAHRLGLEPKNVVVLLGRLATVHRLVDRVGRGTYRVRDPLLKHHVRKEWGSPILR